MANSLYQIKRVVNVAAGKFGYLLARVDTIEGFHARVRSLEQELERTTAEARILGKELEQTKVQAQLEAQVAKSEAARKSAEFRVQETEEHIRNNAAAAEAQIADVECRLKSTESNLEVAAAEVQRLTAQLFESQQRHDAAAAEVQRVTQKLQEVEGKLQETEAELQETEAELQETRAELQGTETRLQESEARNAASMAEATALTSELRNSEARHAASTENAQRVTNELVESRASHMAVLAEVQRLTSAHAVDVERLKTELQACRNQYDAASAELQSITEHMKNQSYARVEQEQYATIFRRKTEELTLELSRREAEMTANIAAERAQSERLAQEAARLTAENARLVCEHSDMATRVAETVKPDRAGRGVGRLATGSSKPSSAPRRLTFQPFRAHEDSMRPVLEQQIIDMDAPQLDPAVQQKIELGRSLSEAIDLYKARKELSDVASVINAQSLSDRLTPHQYGRLLKQQQDTLHLDQRKKHYRESDPSKIYQGISYDIVRKLILSDPSIGSSLNIGCNYAYMDWLLAKQFENVIFRAVDVNPDLPEINSDLQLKNTEFFAGYALELIESGKLHADLVYTSSAATVIRNPELRTYARLIAQRAKYFLISEPVWALPGGEIIDPKMVHPLDSVPAYVQREPLTGDFGYLCWIHNYRAIIESAGFEVVEYRFYKPEIGSYYWCVVLGQNKDTSLWKSENGQ